MTPEEMQVDILMKEYATMRQEILLHFKNAKLHLKHFQGFVAASFAIASYLFFSAEAVRVAAFTDVLGISQSDLVFFVIFSLNVVSYYFAFDILDPYFCMYLAAARVANIEAQINKITEQKLLIWESEFQSKGVAVFGSSRLLITLYQVILVGIVAAVIPFISYGQLKAAGHLTWPGLVGWARGFAVGAFLVFLCALVDVFLIRPGMARRVIDRIVAGKHA